MSAPKRPETITLSTLREAKPAAFPTDIGRPKRTISRTLDIDRRDGASHDRCGTFAHIVARRTALRSTFAATIAAPPAPSAASVTETAVYESSPAARHMLTARKRISRASTRSGMY